MYNVVFYYYADDTYGPYVLFTRADVTYYGQYGLSCICADDIVHERKIMRFYF